MFINSTLPNFDGDFCLDFATARLILPPAAFAVEFIITAAQMFDHLGEREVVPIFAYEGGENLRFRRVEFLAAEHAFERFNIESVFHGFIFHCSNLSIKSDDDCGRKGHAFNHVADILRDDRELKDYLVLSWDDRGDQLPIIGDLDQVFPRFAMFFYLHLH